jgi:hypothetical protein
VQIGDLVIVAFKAASSKVGLITEIRRDDGIGFEDQYVVRMVDGVGSFLLASHLLKKL